MGRSGPLTTKSTWSRLRLRDFREDVNLICAKIDVRWGYIDQMKFIHLFFLYGVESVLDNRGE